MAIGLLISIGVLLGLAVILVRGGAKYVFAVWGVAGLMVIFIIVNPFIGSDISVAKLNALLLVWIGGMIFFGLTSLLFPKAEAESAGNVQK